MWKKGPAGEPGMGQYMIGGQQMFPGRGKKNAEAAYMEAMSSVEKEKNASLNELSTCKQYYYEWLIMKKLTIVTG
jgi:hypothetical protein